MLGALEVVRVAYCAL